MCDMLGNYIRAAQVEGQAQLMQGCAECRAGHLADSRLNFEDGLVDRCAQVNPPILQASVLGHSGELGIFPLQLLF